MYINIYLPEFFLTYKLIFFLFFCFTISAQVNQNNDVQFWSYNSFKRKLKHNCSLRFDNEFRLGNDLSEVYYTYVQLFFEYRPSKFWKIAPGYRQEWIRSSTNPWQSRYIPTLDMFFMVPTDRVIISDRNRVQYQVRKEPNQWVYRNKLKFSFPIQTNPLEVRLFFDNEIFIRQRHGFDQNRTAVGVSFLITDSFHLAPYYLLRFLKRNNRWNHQHVIGFRMNCNF